MVRVPAPRGNLVNSPVAPRKNLISFADAHPGLLMLYERGPRIRSEHTELGKVTSDKVRMHTLGQVAGHFLP